MGFCPLFILWDCVHFPYCEILSTFHIVGLCPLFIAWNFFLCNFVRRDFVLWDSARILPRRVAMQVYHVTSLRKTYSEDIVTDVFE